MIDSLSESYRGVIRAIGEDPEQEGLLDTPQRAAKAMEFLTSGYRQASRQSSTMLCSTQITTRWSWCVTLSCIRCASIICCLSPDAVMSICQTVKYLGYQSLLGLLTCSPGVYKSRKPDPSGCSRGPRGDRGEGRWSRDRSTYFA